MNQTYLNSTKNTVLSLKPSTAIRLLLMVLFFSISPLASFGQTSIWTNPINGTSPAAFNPYTTGQTVNSYITVSGIGFAGIGYTSTGTYNLGDWTTNNAIDLNQYFSFTITPATGYKVSMNNFLYTGASGEKPPTAFAFRTNANGDNFSTNVGAPNALGTTIGLIGANYQNLAAATSFRLYGYNVDGGSAWQRTYAIDDFTFNGSVLGSATTALNFGAVNTYGSAPVQSFQVNGNGLKPATASVTINGSTNYEVSTTSATAGFGATATLTAIGGSLSAATVWVRLKATAIVGAYNENITFGGGGVTGISIACSATVTPAPLTITANNASKCFGTTYALGTSAFTSSALQNGETVGSVTLTSSGAGVGAATGSYAIVPSAAAGGTFTATNYAITYTNGTITINSAPSTPYLGTRTQPICALLTGSVVLSDLPASGTINQTGTVVAGYTITGTSMPISELVAGTYKFTVTNASGCTSPASADVIINAFVASTTTWNVSNNVGSWTNGPPTSSKNLVFSGSYDSSINTAETVIEGCSCKVNSGAVVVFNAGKTLKISNEIKILGPTGSLTFENNASLVQINDAEVNTDKITYNRQTSTARSSDYSYWSSPVADQTLSVVFPNSPSGFFYSYNAFASPEDWKKEAPSTTKMGTATGYILQGPNTSTPPGFYNAEFNGVPNNGLINVPIGKAGTSNLIGNPYPSAIDADQFLTVNSGVIDGTLYFWTHNTALQLASQITNAGSGAFAYTSNDYASYNLTGGVGIDGLTYVKGGTISPSGNTNKPTGKIAAGQAFFTTSITTGKNAVFSNVMRVSGGLLGIDNSQFFKTTKAKSKTATAIEKHRIWLNLTNTEGAFKQTLIGYITGGTNEYDSSFDGESFDANEFVDFYSVYEDKNLVIQGRALPFDAADEVPLGYRTTIEGNFTINIDEVDGSMTDQAVFIEDKLTNTVFNLKTGNYTFNTVAGTFNDRFVLRYNNKTLGTENFNSPANKVLVSNANKQIKINSFAETIDKVVIYDLLGRQVFQKTNVNNNELSIANLISSHQTLVVKTLLQNGNTFTDKIIY